MDDETMEWTLKPIGVIHTPLTDKRVTPIQASRSDVLGTADVFSEYQEGLEGIEEFSHIYFLYGFHRSGRDVSMKVRPFLDDRLHGLFSTRHPCRPNPIGLSVVRLVEVQGNRLTFRGADMLDGTPLWDIKPYIAEFDVFSADKTGWYQNRKFQ